MKYFSAPYALTVHGPRGPNGANQGCGVGVGLNASPTKRGSKPLTHPKIHANKRRRAASLRGAQANNDTGLSTQVPPPPPVAGALTHADHASELKSPATFGYPDCLDSTHDMMAEHRVAHPLGGRRRAVLDHHVVHADRAGREYKGCLVAQLAGLVRAGERSSCWRQMRRHSRSGVPPRAPLFMKGGRACRPALVSAPARSSTRSTRRRQPRRTSTTSHRARNQSTVQGKYLRAAQLRVS